MSHTEDDKQKEFSSFKCVKCGNCCRGEGYVHITPEDASAIARFLNISAQEFYFTYTRRMNGEYWLKDKPNQDCIFLESNLCSIHEVKPQQCKDFPYKWRTQDIVEFCTALQDTRENPRN